MACIQVQAGYNTLISKLGGHFQQSKDIFDIHEQHSFVQDNNRMPQFRGLKCPTQH